MLCEVRRQVLIKMGRRVSCCEDLYRRICIGGHCIRFAIRPRAPEVFAPHNGYERVERQVDAEAERDQEPWDAGGVEWGVSPEEEHLWAPADESERTQRDQQAHPTAHHVDRVLEGPRHHTRWTAASFFFSKCRPERSSLFSSLQRDVYVIQVGKDNSAFWTLIRHLPQPSHHG